MFRDRYSACATQSRSTRTIVGDTSQPKSAAALLQLLVERRLPSCKPPSDPHARRSGYTFLHTGSPAHDLGVREADHQSLGIRRGVRSITLIFFLRHDFETKPTNRGHRAAWMTYAHTFTLTLQNLIHENFFLICITSRLRPYKDRISGALGGSTEQASIPSRGEIVCAKSLTNDANRTARLAWTNKTFPFTISSHAVILDEYDTHCFCAERIMFERWRGSEREGNERKRERERSQRLPLPIEPLLSRLLTSSLR